MKSLRAGMQGTILAGVKGPAMEDATRRLNPAWRIALLHWAGTRVGLGLWAAWIWFQGLMPNTTGFFYKLVSPVLDGWQGAIFGMWQRWDGVHYQAIAESYYTETYQTAFFPAYPLLGRALAQVTGLTPLAALLVISAMATLFCLVLLYRIANDLFSREAAGRTVLATVLFPMAFFLFGVYPQSLALLWVLLAYDQARREHWLAAGLAGLLAGLTHGTIPPLGAMLAVMAWQAIRNSPLSNTGKSGKELGADMPLLRGKTAQNLNLLRPLRIAALMGVAGLPLLGTGVFLAWRVAMGFPAMDALQMSDWGRVVSTPWETLWALVEYIPKHVMENWVIALNTVMLGLALWAVVAGLFGHFRILRLFDVKSRSIEKNYETSRRLPLELSVYQITLLLYFLCTRVTIDPLLGLNRFILVMFPMYLVIGAIPMGRVRQAVLFGVGAMGSLGISAMFFMWKWVG